LILSGKYPSELRAINLDTDWFYRKGARLFGAGADLALNGINRVAELVFARKLPGMLSQWAERLPAAVASILLRAAGTGETRDKLSCARSSMAEPIVRGGLVPIGVSALLAAVFFVVLFLLR
jgi:multicomponent Na+:H+ antiporter subunit D